MKKTFNLFSVLFSGLLIMTTEVVIASNCANDAEKIGRELLNKAAYNDLYNFKMESYNNLKESIRSNSNGSGSHMYIFSGTWNSDKYMTDRSVIPVILYTATVLLNENCIKMAPQTGNAEVTIFSLLPQI